MSAPARRGCTTGTQMPRARPTCIKSSRLLSITAESWRRAHYHFTRAALFAVLDGSWLDSGHTFALLLLSLVRTQRAGRCATQACSAPPRRRALPLCGRDHRANTRLPHATRRFISSVARCCQQWCLGGSQYAFTLLTPHLPTSCGGAMSYKSYKYPCMSRRGSMQAMRSPLPSPWA